MSSEDITKKGISRRNFLKVSAIAAVGAASAGVLAGCASKQTGQPASSSNATGKASFEVPPAPIPDSQIKKTIAADIVVVGAGLAGLCAATSAAQAGAKVVLLEKGKTPSFRGYDYGAIGSKNQQSLGINIDKRQAVREIMRWGGYKADWKVVSLWAEHSGEAIDWLTDMAHAAGFQTEPVPLVDCQTPGALFEPFPTLAIHITPSQDILAKLPSGVSPYTAGMMHTLLSGAQKAGVEIHYETPAAQLVRQDNKGRVTGVIAGAKGNYIKFVAKKGVILCAGDYGSDPEMLKKYIPNSDSIIMNMYQLVSGKINTGDGHKMGLWVGAAMDEYPHAPMYFDFAALGANGQVVLCDALMRQPWLNVNLRGERYSNEELPYSYICNGHRQQPKHLKWVVWDSKWPEEAPRFRQIACKNMRTNFHDPKRVQQLIKDGTIRSASTIEELAQKMKVPVDTFKATVARYNELARTGNDLDFGKRRECLTTIEKAPFYAANVGTALLVTLGGLRINEKLQVLDNNLVPIPGLYAAGNNSGSFYSNDYPNILPGNSHGRAITTGWLAGKIAAGQQV